MADRRYVDHRTGEVIDEPDIRPFNEVLEELSEGATHQEMSETFWDLLQKVQDTGKNGSLTLTIVVASDGMGRLVMKDEIKSKMPEHNRPTTSFFVSKHGNASRRDPNQPEIPGVAHINRKETS